MKLIHTLLLTLAVITIGACDSPQKKAASGSSESRLEDVFGKVAGIKGNAILVEVPNAPDTDRPGTISIPTTSDTRILVDGEKMALEKIEKGRDVLIARHHNGYAVSITTIIMPSVHR